jgi:hypothetical protein
MMPVLKVRRDQQDEWLRAMGQLGRHHHCAGGCYKEPPIGYRGRHARPRHARPMDRQCPELWLADGTCIPVPPSVIGPAGYPSYRGRHRR